MHKWFTSVGFGKNFVRFQQVRDGKSLEPAANPEFKSAKKFVDDRKRKASSRLSLEIACHPTETKSVKPYLKVGKQWQILTSRVKRNVA